MGRRKNKKRICKICGVHICSVVSLNVSPIRGYPVCEGCAADFTKEDWCLIRIRLYEDEGVKLNHCVDKSGRYFERIVSRESYIFFLRRAENPDLPWYTLEVEPDGTIRQKRSFGDKQHEDLEAARPFLKEWQTVVAGRLEEEDLAAAGVSREKRIENYKDLRDSKKRIYDGRLLADVLEADLEENLEVRIA